MEQLALIVPGMWADHHVITVRGLFHDEEGVEVTGASAMDADASSRVRPGEDRPAEHRRPSRAGRLPHRRRARGRRPADGQARLGDVGGACHHHRPGRPRHVGRPPQVLIAQRPVSVHQSTSVRGLQRARRLRAPSAACA